MGKCKFSSLWLSDERFSAWLDPVPGKTGQAHCKFCMSNFDVSNMGVAALLSHMDGKKHSKKAEDKAKSPMDRFVRRAEAANVSASSTTRISAPTASGTLDSFVSGNAVLSAEVYWALNVVKKNYSFNSSTQVGNLWSKMFPDSSIASKFSCGESKCSYLTTFGIAPHFSSLLRNTVRQSSDYVVCFDESLNFELQQKQMDMHICLWDAGRVGTRYFTSAFLGQADADRLHGVLSDCCDEVGKRGILQISMDGPNVNWKTFDLLYNEVEQEVHHGLIDVGVVWPTHYAQRFSSWCPEDQVGH